MLSRPYDDWRASLDRLRRRELGEVGTSSLLFSEYAVRTLRRVSDGRIRHNGCINTCAFSEDGLRLLSGSDDCYLKLWDVKTRRLSWELRTRHQHNIFCVQFARHDPGMILSGAADGTIRAYRLDSTAEQVLLRSDNIVHSFLVDMHNPVIVYSAEECGFVSRIDLRTRATEVIFRNRQPSSSGRLRCVKALVQADVFAGGQQLAVGGHGFSVGLLDLRRASRSENSEDSLAQTFSPLGRTTVSRPAISARSSPTYSDVSVSGMRMGRGDRVLAVSYQGDQVYLFDPTLRQRRGDEVCGASACLGGHINHATFLKTVDFFGPRDEFVVAGSDGGDLFIWDARSGGLLPTYSKYGTTHGVGSLPDDELADREACRIINVLRADSNTCNGVIAHPYLPMLASYGIDSTLKLWCPQILSENSSGKTRRTGDHWVDHWDSFGPESVYHSLPETLDCTLDRLLSSRESARNDSFAVSVAYGTSRSFAIYDLFSFHRTVAGIRAIMCNGGSGAEEFPVDAGLVQRRRISNDREVVELRNCRSVDGNHELVQHLIGFVRESMLEYVPQLGSKETFRTFRGLYAVAYSVMEPLKASSHVPPSFRFDVLVRK